MEFFFFLRYFPLPRSLCTGEVIAMPSPRYTNGGWPGASKRPSMESRRFRIVAEMKTWLFCMWFCPCRRATSRPWIPFRWKKSIGADHEKLWVNLKFIGFLSFYAAVVSPNFNLLAVSLYRLIYLLIRCSSIFFLISHLIKSMLLPLCSWIFKVKGYTSQGKNCFLIYPDTVYCTQTENVPIYLSARVTRVLICRLCKSSSTIFQDKHIDYRVIELIFEWKMRNKIAKCLSWDLCRKVDIEPQKLF